MANCHMDNPPDPTQFTVTVNIAQLAGSLVGILKNQVMFFNLHLLQMTVSLMLVCV